MTGTIRWARAAAACTRAAAGRARALAPPEMHHKIRVVRHGLQAPAGEEQTGEREPVALAVGRLVEKKGIPVLLAAVRLLRDKGRKIECVILGDGADRTAVERTVADLGIEHAARLRGWVSHEEVRRWMARAAVLVVPSVVTPNGDRDGLPNVILEAAAWGLPVVASDVGGIGEFVSNEATGLLVSPGDGGGLAAAIERIMDDESLRRKVTEAARTKVRREYDADENAGALIEAMGWKS